MTWTTLQPEAGASAARAEEGNHAQQEPIDGALPVDPGHVRTRQHHESMLRELQGQK
ncbi:hypothetical protein [Janthinobacterium sp. MP5059B]|uniref:hypothetical protein n=1 Tax=Janthinobacterium sp. MP5059B TaxID=1766683 RepID=UPI001C30DBC5|nr:hypothetical protein [Janthinobacterium sp. MP5059B]